MRLTRLLRALAATILSVGLHPASVQTVLSGGFAAILRKLSLNATRLSAVPSVGTHPAPAPRIALATTQR
jgi:hypothetical protein